MSKKQQVMKLAEELSVEVTQSVSGSTKEVMLEAPDGYYFYASSCHICCLVIYEEDSMTLAWGAALEDLRGGLLPCTAHDQNANECLPATEVIQIRKEP